MLARRGRGIASGTGVLALIVCAFGVPTAADASRVAVKEIDIGPRQTARGGTPVVVYTAGGGERNKLRMIGGFTTRVIDRGAVIKAGAGCDRVTAHRAKCEVPMTRRLEFLFFARANLKGGSDRADGADVFWQRLRGGPGADRLSGGDAGDFIDGGTGSDLIKGGKEQPFNVDTAVYTSRRDDLRVDLNGQGRDDGGPRDGKPGKRDRLVGIESVYGGKGDDLLRGDAGVNTLVPLLGEDVVFGFGGDDSIDLGVEADGGGAPDQQADAVDCGVGNDSLQGHDMFDAIAASCEA